MSANEPLIMVIDGAAERALYLKEMIEFMDVPTVRIATPDNWQSRLGDNHLTAIFLGNNIPSSELERLVGSVGDFDPDVPFVFVEGEPSA